jgi:hypothetical protein
MDLMTIIVSAAGAVVGGVIVKVVADDAREWAPWAARRLLDGAVQRLPESKRERCAEEWPADLDERPGVIAKLYTALSFHIAAFKIRNSDDKSRLEKWQKKRVFILQTIGLLMDALSDCALNHEVVDDAGAKRRRMIEGELTKAIYRFSQLQAERPPLRLTKAGISIMSDMAYGNMMLVRGELRLWATSKRKSALKMLTRRPRI